jgi:hypothetical protein
MSQRHLTKPKEPPPSIARWKLALGAALFIALVSAFWIADN